MTNVEYRPACGLTALLWRALRQVPQGDSITLIFTLRDARLGLVDLTVTLLEELALTQQIALELEPRWPNRLTITRISDTS